MAAGLATLTILRDESPYAYLDALAALSGAPVLLAGAATGLEAFTRAAEAGIPLGDRVAAAALAVARPLVEGAGIALEVLVFDREGALRGRAADHDLNLRT